jgi:hypothetical protein
MQAQVMGSPVVSPFGLDAEINRWLSSGCGTHLGVELVMQLVDGVDVFLEGRGGARTFAAALQLRPDGSAVRRLLLTCPLVEPPAAWEPTPRPPLLPLLERYFDALNDGRFAEAGQAFSEDCLYVHPPYRTGEPPAVFQGREALVAEWPARRGVKRVETRIARVVQAGNYALVEGVAAGGSFLSSAVLDPDGLIARYVAFYTPDLAPRPAEWSLVA